MEEEERQQYREQLRTWTDLVQKQMEATIECKVDDVIDLSANIVWTPIKMDGEEESNDKEQEVKDVADSPRTFLFRERMKKLLSHRLPLKERMKDQSINYVDLLCPDPYPIRLDKDPMPRVLRRLVVGKK